MGFRIPPRCTPCSTAVQDGEHLQDSAAQVGYEGPYREASGEEDRVSLCAQRVGERRG